MLKRLTFLLLLAWALGFAWFALALPQPHAGGKTDGVIVLNPGGPGDSHFTRTSRPVSEDSQCEGSYAVGVSQGRSRAAKVNPAPFFHCSNCPCHLFRP